MKISLDTNVFVSGLFWPGGPPRIILTNWRSIPTIVEQDNKDVYARFLDSANRGAFKIAEEHYKRSIAILDRLLDIDFSP